MRAKNIKLFIEELSVWPTTCGWSEILEIPRDINQPLVDTDNLMAVYGTIPMVRVRAHTAMYIQTGARATQDLYQIYLCIMAALTKEAKSRIALQKDQYCINKIPSEALL
jgi:hypothetical protein